MMDGWTRSAAGPGFSQSRVCKRVWRLQLGGHLGSMSSTAKTKPPCWRRLWVEMSARRVGGSECWRGFRFASFVDLVAW